MIFLGATQRGARATQRRRQLGLPVACRAPARHAGHRQTPRGVAWRWTLVQGAQRARPRACRARRAPEGTASRTHWRWRPPGPETLCSRASVETSEHRTSSSLWLRAAPWGRPSSRVDSASSFRFRRMALDACPGRSESASARLPGTQGAGRDRESLQSGGRPCRALSRRPRSTTPTGRRLSGPGTVRFGNAGNRSFAPCALCRRSSRSKAVVVLFVGAPYELCRRSKSTAHRKAPVGPLGLLRNNMKTSMLRERPKRQNKQATETMKHALVTRPQVRDDIFNDYMDFMKGDTKGARLEVHGPKCEDVSSDN